MAMEHLTADLTMAQETLAECLTEPVKDLLLLHWTEIAPHADIPLDPNFAGYEALEASGVLRCYILRDQGIVQGYAVFMVVYALKYQTSKEAYCDLLFVMPRLRGGLIGARFLQFCDEQLAKEGVVVVRHCVERTYDYSKTLLRVGYEPEQSIYCKRLDREA